MNSGDRDRSPSPSGGNFSSTPPPGQKASSNQEQSIVAKEQSEVTEKGREETEKRYPAPNPAFGDRRSLMRTLERLPEPFSARLRQLVETLDNILVESYTEIALMESFERDVNVIMALVEDFDRSGEK